MNLNEYSSSNANMNIASIVMREKKRGFSIVSNHINLIENATAVHFGVGLETNVTARARARAGY